MRISSSSMPAYSCALTTELLSVGTAGASYDDMRHALPDDGIFKQVFSVDQPTSSLSSQ